MDDSIVLKITIILLWRDSGKKISLMGLEGALIILEIIMSATMSMVRERDLASTFGPMEIFMMVLGMKIINMDTELFILKKQQSFILDTGKMIKFIEKVWKKKKFQRIIFL